MNGIGAKNNSPRNWKEARRKVDREGECRACGSIHGLQAAHVVPRSLGGGQSEDSIIPLCGQCHSRYDKFRLDILPLLSKDEQAEAVRVMGIERARRRLAPSAYAGRRIGPGFVAASGMKPSPVEAQRGLRRVLSIYRVQGPTGDPVLVRDRMARAAREALDASERKG